MDAAAAPAGCTSTNVCFWDGYNYSDGPGKLSGWNSNWSVFKTSRCSDGDWENCASSVYNNGTSCSAVLWTGRSYSGSRLTLGRGSGQTRLSSTMNNAISSNSWSC
ncbi:peptidase inhibitor family I36 protein [Streptomyces albus]|uniref:peptidase inhibitor family I36 protein n=1 Tax=Streptomyces albus TaxID=1888 RepID=UPI0034E24963